jgi:hypothetical protein
MADTTAKGVILCIAILFLLVLAAIIMAAIALANQGSTGNVGFTVTKVTSTGVTNITVDGHAYVQAIVTATSGSATIHFTGQNGSVALVRNSGSTVPVSINTDANMYILSNQTVANSYVLRANTYALLIWEGGNVHVAPL